MTIPALAPCASCARHVRVGGEVCPFCGASILGIAAPAVRRRSGARWTRAALFAGTALLGTSALGCGGGSSTTTEETTVEETPVEETTGDETMPEEGTTEEGTTEEGTTEEGEAEDGSEPHTLYGGPPADVLV